MKATTYICPFCEGACYRFWYPLYIASYEDGNVTRLKFHEKCPMCSGRGEVTVIDWTYEETPPGDESDGA